MQLSGRGTGSRLTLSNTQLHFVLHVYTIRIDGVYLFTGLDHWTGLLDLPLTPKIEQIWNLALRLCQFVHYSADGLVLLANSSHFATMVLVTVTVTLLISC